MAMERHDLLFSVRRSIRYHVRRRSFFDRLNLSANAFSLIFSSAAIYTALSQLGTQYTVAAAGLVTVVSAINLVVGSARMARLHDDLARRFIALEKVCILAGDKAPEEEVAKCMAARLEIEADEPPVMRVLDSICHNDVLRALGYDRSHFLHIAFYQRWFAQIVDIRDHTIGARG